MFHRRILIAVLLAPLLSGEAESKQKLTVAAAIQTTRAMSAAPVWNGAAGSGRSTLDTGSTFISPNGQKYAIMLIRGDVERNGNHVQILVGSLDSLEKATPEPIVELFTDSLGGAQGVNYGASELTMPGRNAPVWFNDDELALFWNDVRGVRQVMTVDTRTKRHAFATAHPTDVTKFAISPSGWMLYSARVPIDVQRKQRLMSDGFLVNNPEAFSLLIGGVDGYGRQDERNNVEMYVGRVGEEPRRVKGPNNDVSIYSSVYFRPVFSPDGRKVLVEWSSGRVGDLWQNYTNDHIKRFIGNALEGDKDLSRALLQFYVVDVESAAASPLWNAPANTAGARNVRIAWAADSRSILLGPTYLPPTDRDSLGLSGEAVAEVDVESGSYRRVPLAASEVSKGVVDLRWGTGREIEVLTGSERLSYRRSGQQWRKFEGISRRGPEANVVVELRQNLNSPPVFYGKEARTNDERVVLDLNPSLRSDFTLAKVEHRQWSDSEGRTWTGLIYFPPGYTPGKRYPLVIQTHGYAPVTEYSLNGNGGSLPGVGPSVGVYAAQPIANEGIMVLQMGSQRVTGVSGTPEEPRMQMRAFETAIDYLDREQLIDREKVGLLGHSRFAWIVQYALTKTDFPYAAAIASDGTDMGYITASLLGWPTEYSDVNGGPPYGDSLKRWIENAPAFNADKIRTPLQMQWATASLPGGLLLWEMFSRLRALGRPVEMYAAPQIRYGSHTLQNPVQCLGVQQRAVDWWKFWLLDEEDVDPAKREQYELWRRLKARHLELRSPG